MASKSTHIKGTTCEVAHKIRLLVSYINWDQVPEATSKEVANQKGEILQALLVEILSCRMRLGRSDGKIYVSNEHGRIEF